MLNINSRVNKVEIVNLLHDNVNFEIFEAKDNSLCFNGYNREVSLYSDGQFYGFK